MMTQLRAAKVTFVASLVVVALVVIILFRQEVTGIASPDVVLVGRSVQYTVNRQQRRAADRTAWCGAADDSSSEPQVPPLSTDVLSVKYRWRAAECFPFARAGSALVDKCAPGNDSASPSSECSWFASHSEDKCVLPMSGSFDRELNLNVVDAHLPQFRIPPTSPCRSRASWANTRLNFSGEAAVIGHGRFVTPRSCLAHVAECGTKLDAINGSEARAAASQLHFRPLEALAVLRGVSHRATAAAAAAGAVESGPRAILMSGDSMVRQLFLRLVHFLRDGDDEAADIVDVLAQHGGTSSGSGGGDDGGGGGFNVVEQSFHTDAMYAVFTDGDALQLLYDKSSSATTADENDPQLEDLRPYASVRDYFDAKFAEQRAWQSRKLVLAVHFLWDVDHERSRQLEPSGASPSVRKKVPDFGYALHIHSFGYWWVNRLRLKSSTKPDPSRFVTSFLEPLAARLRRRQASSRGATPHVILLGTPLLHAVHNARHVFNALLSARDDAILRWSSAASASAPPINHGSRSGHATDEPFVVETAKKELIDSLDPFAVQSISSSPFSSSSGPAVELNGPAVPTPPGRDGRVNSAPPLTKSFPTTSVWEERPRFSFIDVQGIVSETLDVIARDSGTSVAKASLKLRCDGTHFMCTMLPRAPFHVQSGVTGLKTAAYQDAACAAPRCRDDVNLAILQFLLHYLAVTDP